MGEFVLDASGRATFGEKTGGPNKNTVKWQMTKKQETPPIATKTAYTRDEAVDLKDAIDVDFDCFDGEAASIFGSVYSNMTSGAKIAFSLSIQLTAPENAGTDGTFGGPVQWMVEPVFCDGDTGLGDVQWWVRRRESGEDPVDTSITRQNAFDLTDDANTSWSAFDSTAGTLLGTDYSDDDADARKCLWKAFGRFAPEDPA